jgi:hypothetical protein
VPQPSGDVKKTLPTCGARTGLILVSLPSDRRVADWGIPYSRAAKSLYSRKLSFRCKASRKRTPQGRKEKAAGRNRVGTHGRESLSSFRLSRRSSRNTTQKLRLLQVLVLGRGETPLFTYLPRAEILGN